jgi:UDP-N-acetylglucosamine acyltransferase
MSASMIDPSARIEAGAQIGKNVSIGPCCTIGPHVAVGDDCRLLAHVNLTGHTSIGPRTVIHSFASLGGAPQSFSYKGEPTKLVVGADCDIREHVTMSTGTAGDRGITTVGDKCFFMVGAHVAHDCQIGNNFVCANNVMLAGHVIIGDNVVFGGGVAVRQFVRIGDGAMVVGLSGARADIIPWGMALGAPLADLVGLNVIGMRRSGVTKAEILTLRRAYQALFFGGGEFRARLDQVDREFGGDARVRKIIDFIRAGKRPLTMAVKRAESDEDL